MDGNAALPRRRLSTARGDGGSADDISSSIERTATGQPILAPFRWELLSTSQRMRSNFLTVAVRCNGSNGCEQLFIFPACVSRDTPNKPKLDKKRSSNLQKKKSSHACLSWFLTYYEVETHLLKSCDLTVFRDAPTRLLTRTRSDTCRPIRRPKYSTVSKISLTLISAGQIACCQGDRLFCFQFVAATSPTAMLTLRCL